MGGAQMGDQAGEVAGLCDLAGVDETYRHRVPDRYRRRASARAS